MEPKKKNIIVYAIFFFIFCFADAQDVDFLKINASVSPNRLSRGQEGKVVIEFVLDEGITVNAQPSFTIEIEPSEELVFPKNFFNASDLRIEICEDGEDEYLNLKKPIEIPFTVSLDAKQGRHPLEGKVKYFACSKEEAWCLKSTAKFSVSYFIRNQTIKKNLSIN